MLDEVREILKATLQLGDSAENLTFESELLGAMPEFDSMAVVTIITMIEEDFDIEFDDDEITADVFATVGSLADLISAKVNA
jgi:acyl carrier protein